MRVLHAAAELFPYVKVGGLADVLGALPQALRQQGVKARLLLPGYGILKAQLLELAPAAEIPDLMGLGPAPLLLGRTASGVPTYLLDRPDFFERPGGIYDDGGDSHLRFGAFSFAAAWLAQQGDRHGWGPSVLHVHDWQVGLAPAYLALWGGARPATVITVHNLAYQGRYGSQVLGPLHLPRGAFHMNGLEYHGDLSFLKAGLQYADRITTVSPTYAREIQAPDQGEGLDGLLTHRRADLVGILNGVDESVWHPMHSPHLPAHYDLAHRSGKKVCKNHLQRELGLAEALHAPVFGVVSRFAHQKGLDLVLANVEHLMGLGAQLAILGSGDPDLQAGFVEATRRHPGRVGLRQGYDEALAHRIIAGSDALLVPSRHEPCGLTQLYALKYGTLPVVRWTGGLADTVVDTSEATLAEGTATGFVFGPVDGWALGEALNRACALFAERPRDWSRVQHTAMRQDFSWRVSARRYVELYHGLGA